ncbi:MAG: type II toxin-antitoxin system RatA family toxin [Steroidobacteraceae bacterium]
MREVRRKSLVPRTAKQIFELIDDIEAYPQFLPWCNLARVESRTADTVVATLGVERGPLHTEFTTRNDLERYRRIGIELVSGPFTQLRGGWSITPIGAAGCEVALALQFEFRNALLRTALEAAFAQTVGSLLDAFVNRARELPADAADPDT